jgi:TetR/AcrR family transcriptional repressor of nem operon
MPDVPPGTRDRTGDPELDCALVIGGLRVLVRAYSFRLMVIIHRSEDDQYNLECQAVFQHLEVPIVGSSQADKAASHERIVKIAAARIRRNGLDDLAVANLMSEAGLTHGGFYRHFKSRDDLLTEAVALALAQGSARTRAAASKGGLPAFRLIIDGYLSTSHRDNPESGCAVAALAEDVTRASDRTREAYARQVLEYLDLLASLTPGDDPGDTHQAILTLSALVGALSIARAVSDPDLSQRILKETAESLKSLSEPCHNGPDNPRDQPLDAEGR